MIYHVAVIEGPHPTDMAQCLFGPRMLELSVGPGEVLVGHLYCLEPKDKEKTHWFLRGVGEYKGKDVDFVGFYQTITNMGSIVMMDSFLGK
jgi:hypothetical protein